MNFLEPNIRRFRKFKKGMNKGIEVNATRLSRGTFGIVALSRGFLKANQYETARKAFVQLYGKKAKVIPRFHLNRSKTKKPSENRMGKGKGDIDFWMFTVKPGRVIFEVKTYENFPLVKDALKASCYKLPFKTKIISMV